MKTAGKITACVLAMVMILALSACGAKPDASTEPASKDADLVESPTTSEVKIVNWPTQDVKILTTVKAGGNMDIKARLVAKYLADVLGVNVIVENAPGGGGVTGMTQYLAEKPNTHTLIYMGVPHLTTAPFFSDVEYSEKDIEILSALDTVENGLFVSKKSGTKNLDDLLALGKDGKTIKFGSAGVNNDTFLFTKVLFEQAGVASDSVDAGSSAEALVNCMAGTVDVAYSAMNLARSYVESGDMIPIGVFSAEDYTGYDGITVPTFKSQGYDISYKATSFFAIRSGTDKEILDKISDALNTVFTNPDFQKEFADAGFVMMNDRSKDKINAEINNLIAQLDGYKELLK